MEILQNKDAILEMVGMGGAKAIETLLSELNKGIVALKNLNNKLNEETQKDEPNINSYDQEILRVQRAIENPIFDFALNQQFARERSISIED